MADTALHLVDRVLPEVPVRQWVLSVPRRIRYLFARDAVLLSGALRIFISEVFRRLRRRARAETGRKSRGLLPGAVTGVQRFGSALNLNVHFHSMVLDGVHVRDPETGTLGFLSLPEPTQEELVDVLSRTRNRIEAFLRKRGCCMGGEDGGEEEGGLLDRLRGASILGRDGMSGEPRRTELWGRREEGAARMPVEKPCTAAWEGWSLQAGVRVRAGNREGLGRLCRYILRPPFAGERLEELSDGRVLYRFRKPMPDGSSHAVMEPLEFLAKLAALVPPPRSHLVHYHGSLAPRSRSRGRVVPAPAPASEGGCGCRQPEAGEDGATEPDLTMASTPAGVEGLPRDGVRRAEGQGERLGEAGPARAAGEGKGAGGPSDPSEVERPAALIEAARRPSRTDWATLLRRTLGLDALKCEGCGGRMRVLASLTEPAAIRRFLASMGLPVDAPGPEPPRRPPQGEFDFVQYG